MVRRRKPRTPRVYPASGAVSPQPQGACCEGLRAAVSCCRHPCAGLRWTAPNSLTPAAVASALHGNTSPPAAVSAPTPESYRGRKPINNWYAVYFPSGYLSAGAICMGHSHTLEMLHSYFCQNIVSQVCFLEIKVKLSEPIFILSAFTYRNSHHNKQLP